MDETLANPFINDKYAKISRAAVELLGRPERMLYPSKSMRQPSTIFNANVYDANGEKIWYGDLEIEKDKKNLIKLPNRIGTIYILREMDGRFLEEKPTLAYVKNKSIVTIEVGNISYSEGFKESVKMLSEKSAPKAVCNQKPAGKAGKPETRKGTL